MASVTKFVVFAVVLFVISQITESHWIGGWGGGYGYPPPPPPAYGFGRGYGVYGGGFYGGGFYGPRLPPPIIWG